MGKVTTTGQDVQLEVTDTLLADSKTKADEHTTEESAAPAEEERETWGKKIDFLLSVVGFAVDLANVWRFPYLCYKNGGGAFLVPYAIMLIFGGIPLFYMELALGQYFRKGAVSTWGQICPIFKGIGWAVVLIAFYTDLFYNVIISWALYYFFASFRSQLPWTECGNWSTEACFSGHMSGEKFPNCVFKHREEICADYDNFTKMITLCNSDGNVSCDTLQFDYPVIDRSEVMMSSFKSEINSLFNETLNPAYNSLYDTITLNVHLMDEYCQWKPNSSSPAAEYFNREVLGLHESSGIESIGTIRWQNALCLLAIYIICFLSLFRGISTSGKVVWFTALFPYVVLFILLIRGVTLPGAMDGIREYITPKFHSILKAGVWVDAATQVFFSLGPGFGVLLAFASYNKFHNNVYRPDHRVIKYVIIVGLALFRDALITSMINCGTSFLAGFVVFSILGYLSHKTCKEFYTVAQEGPGLVFEVYPEAIATLPGSTFWSLIFFLMLLTLGLDSSFGGSEAIITGITDEFPALKKYRGVFVGVLFSCYYLVGLASCTYGGYYVMKVFEVFAAGYSILFAVFCESVVVSWIYGVWRFSTDIKLMIGQPPQLFWVTCWSLIAPVFIGCIMVYGLIQYTPLSHGEYKYPGWANAFGWIVAGSSMACIPIVGIVKIIKHKADWVYLFNGWWSNPQENFTSLKHHYICWKNKPSKHDNHENGDANPTRDELLNVTETNLTA